MEKTLQYDFPTEENDVGGATGGRGMQSHKEDLEGGQCSSNLTLLYFSIVHWESSIEKRLDTVAYQITLTINLKREWEGEEKARNNKSRLAMVTCILMDYDRL